MDYFSVVYQGMADTIQTEEQLSDRLSDLESRLMSCNMKALGIASLANKGYHSKIYKLCSSVGSRQIDVYRMSQGLMKACDVYRSYELQVLKQAEDVITAKNGFSKKSVKQAKKAVSGYEKQVEKTRYIEEKTFGSILYDSTIGQWKESWKGCKEAFSIVGDVITGGAKWVFSVKIGGILESLGVPEPVLEAYQSAADKGIDAIEGKLETYENIVVGITDFPNPESVKNGVVTVAAGMTGGTELEGIDKVIERGMDAVMPGSEAAAEYEAMAAQALEAFRNGDYLEGAAIYTAGSARTLGQGIADAGTNIIGGWTDDVVKDISKSVTGEEASLVDALNGGESLMNDFAGWMNGMRG